MPSKRSKEKTSNLELDVSNIKEKNIFRIGLKKEMSFEDNIKKNNLHLPAAPDPVGSYVASKKVGNFSLYIRSNIN